MSNVLKITTPKPYAINGGFVCDDGTISSFGETRDEARLEFERAEMFNSCFQVCPDEVSFYLEDA